MAERNVETRFYNPNVKVGDTVIAQDLVDEEMDLPLDKYNSGVYELTGTRPVAGATPEDSRVEVILNYGERIINLSDLMEHGIDDGERLTVISKPEKANKTMYEILQEDPHAWLE